MIIKEEYQNERNKNFGEIFARWFNSETETIIFFPATKNDYIFGGWYKDSDFSNQILKIEKGSSENITIYAKWIPRFSFNDTSLEVINVGATEIADRSRWRIKL